LNANPPKPLAQAGHSLTRTGEEKVALLFPDPCAASMEGASASVGADRDLLAEARSAKVEAIEGAIIRAMPSKSADG